MSDKFIKLARALGMSYCTPSICNCGDCSYLMFTNEDNSTPSMPSTIVNGDNTTRQNTISLYASLNLPDWSNGADPTSLYEWAQHAAWNNQFLRDRMEVAGLRLYRKYE